MPGAACTQLAKAGIDTSQIRRGSLLPRLHCALRVRSGLPAPPVQHTARHSPRRPGPPAASFCGRQRRIIRQFQLAGAPAYEIPHRVTSGTTASTALPPTEIGEDVAHGLGGRRQGGRLPSGDQQFKQLGQPRCPHEESAQCASHAINAAGTQRADPFGHARRLASRLDSRRSEPGCAAGCTACTWTRGASWRLRG